MTDDIPFKTGRTYKRPARLLRIDGEIRTLTEIADHARLTPRRLREIIRRLRKQGELLTWSHLGCEALKETTDD